jgi:hypothetical protein
MKYELKEQGGVLSFYQLEAQSLDFAPGLHLIGQAICVPLLRGIEILVDMSVYGVGIGGADHCLFQQEEIKCVACKKLIHEKFQGCNL